MAVCVWLYVCGCVCVAVCVRLRLGVKQDETNIYSSSPVEKNTDESPLLLSASYWLNDAHTWTTTRVD